jgi:hypothetical protein
MHRRRTDDQELIYHGFSHDRPTLGRKF